MDVYERRAMARDPRTPSEVLTLLAKDKDHFVRQAIAENTQ